MKKRLVTLMMALCLVLALAVPAVAAETESGLVSVDDIEIDVAAITDAPVNKKSIGNDVYEFQLSQRVETTETQGREEILCNSTKIIAVGEEEAQKVEGNIRKIQNARSTFSGGTVSGSYLGGSATLSSTTTLWSETKSGVLYYKIVNLETSVAVGSGVTFENKRVDFFANGYNMSGVFVTQEGSGYFRLNNKANDTVGAPSSWAHIKKTYDADIGGNYVCKLTKNGATTTVTLKNYYF